MDRRKAGTAEGSTIPYTAVIWPAVWPEGWLEVYLGEVEWVIRTTGVRVQHCQGRKGSQFSDKYLRRKVMLKLKQLGFVVAMFLLLLVPAGLVFG